MTREPLAVYSESDSGLLRPPAERSLAGGCGATPASTCLHVHLSTAQESKRRTLRRDTAAAEERENVPGARCWGAGVRRTRGPPLAVVRTPPHRPRPPCRWRSPSLSRPHRSRPCHARRRRRRHCRHQGRHGRPWHHRARAHSPPSRPAGCGTAATAAAAHHPSERPKRVTEEGCACSHRSGGLTWR